VIVPVLPEGAEGVGEWLSERRGRKCALLAPQRGFRVDLAALARDNAAHAFREQQRAQEDVEERLAQIQRRLRLPTLPHRIECCDISHLGGGDTVGAVVALLDGKPDKARYRTFHVKGVAAGDDYGAMYQVLARRFRRGRAAGEARVETEAEAEGTRDRIEWDLPDLFVVDGGRGQLQVALTAARDLGLHDLPIVGLAKERATPGVPGRPDLPPGAAEEPAGYATNDEAPAQAADAGAPEPPPASPGAGKGSRRGKKPAENVVDRVYLPGQKNGIPLLPNSAALFFLARARDEAHRFSNRARERLGKVRRIRSVLDDVPGVGPVARTALLRAFGGVEAIRDASDEALLAVEGVTRRTVKALRARFSSGTAPPDGSDQGPRRT
jgi:excinuclease ABC subunit C